MTVSSTTLNESDLERSHAFCRDLTRRAAKNFYYGLRLLPEPKRSAMFCLYAYMRLVDDIADEEDGRSVERRSADLNAWRSATLGTIAGEPLAAHHESLVWPALAQTVAQYHIPSYVFEDAIEGQRDDLRPVALGTFAQLCEYCRRVAGVVGVASIHIWGFEGGAETEQMAIDLGVAFQITNILRDLREDAARGRSYLPREELAAAGLDPQSLLSASGEKFNEFMHFQIDRAEDYYARAADLERRISRDSRPTLRAMTSIYHCLLKKVARRPERVLHQRVSLSVPAKLLIGWRALRAK